MKKLLKFVTGVAAVAGAVCGVIYCLKRFCGIDLLKRDEDFEDFDEEFDEDFEDDFEDDNVMTDEADEESDTEKAKETGDREYVTLDMEGGKVSEDNEESEEADVTSQK